MFFFMQSLHTLLFVNIYHMCYLNTNKCVFLTWVNILHIYIVYADTVVTQCTSGLNKNKGLKVSMSLVKAIENS